MTTEWTESTLSRRKSILHLIYNSYLTGAVVVDWYNLSVGYEQDVEAYMRILGLRYGFIKNVWKCLVLDNPNLCTPIHNCYCVIG